MASACVNSSIGVVSPDNNFLNMGWLSPRISFKDSPSSPAKNKIPESSSKIPDLLMDPTESYGGGDFEFCFDVHDDPVAILPADQLFSDGKLVPLHFPKPPQSQPHTAAGSKDVAVVPTECYVTSPEKDKEKAARKSIDGFGNDPYLFSPKAPRCSSRWRELLGLKNKRTPSQNGSVKAAVVGSKPSSIRQLLHRNSRMSTSSSSNGSSDGSNLPLLHRSSDSSSMDCSSRFSLSSSSSSGHEYDELPRLSLDAEKLSMERHPSRESLSFGSSSRPKVRLVRPRMVPSASSDHPSSAAEQRRIGRIGRSPMQETQHVPRGVSVDSPRMNPSGKIVFQSLERSSSSPSTFNGGPRHKHRGMERSYSANVRITPVLNVPVCSLRGSSKSGSVFGFGQLFSSSSSSSSSTTQSQKKDKENSNGHSNNGGSASSRYHQYNYNQRRKESS